LSQSRLAAWIGLSLIPGLGPRGTHTLLQVLGSPESTLGASAGTLSPLVGEHLAKAICAGPPLDAIERTLAWADSPGHHLLTWEDADYPQALLQIPDPPPTIYYLGRLDLLQAPALAIVGSRNATAQGQDNARAFAQALSEAGLTIVSGLALGIDTAAHEGGLAGRSSSVAVLGTGIDRVYPAKNRALAHRLAQAGGLLSEFPLGAPPQAGHFPRRNRLISGLAKGCLVVEATLNSGSLITARIALEQGREILAIPGSIHSPFAKGPHRLIREGAKLVETAQDVLEELQLAPARPRLPDLPAPEKAKGELGALLAALGHDPVNLDQLTERSGIGIDRLAALLLDLELAGEVQTLAGARYQRRSRKGQATNAARSTS